MAPPTSSVPTDDPTLSHIPPLDPLDPTALRLCGRLHRPPALPLLPPFASIPFVYSSSCILFCLNTPSLLAGVQLPLPAVGHHVTLSQSLQLFQDMQPALQSSSICRCAVLYPLASCSCAPSRLLRCHRASLASPALVPCLVLGRRHRGALSGMCRRGRGALLLPARTRRGAGSRGGHDRSLDRISNSTVEVGGDLQASLRADQKVCGLQQSSVYCFPSRTAGGEARPPSRRRGSWACTARLGPPPPSPGRTLGLWGVGARWPREMGRGAGQDEPTTFPMQRALAPSRAQQPPAAPWRSWPRPRPAPASVHPIPQPLTAPASQQSATSSFSTMFSRVCLALVACALLAAPAGEHTLRWQQPCRAAAALQGRQRSIAGGRGKSVGEACALPPQARAPRPGTRVPRSRGG